MAEMKKDSEQLLDRHKVASCICGAFLYVSVFNKRLVEHIKETRESMEAYFYYVNEFVLFYAGEIFFEIGDKYVG